MSPLSARDVVKSPKGEGKESVIEKFKEMSEKKRLRAVEARNQNLQNKSEFRIQQWAAKINWDPIRSKCRSLICLAIPEEEISLKQSIHFFNYRPANPKAEINPAFKGSNYLN